MEFDPLKKKTCIPVNPLVRGRLLKIGEKFKKVGIDGGFV